MRSTSRNKKTIVRNVTERRSFLEIFLVVLMLQVFTSPNQIRVQSFSLVPCDSRNWKQKVNDKRQKIPFHSVHSRTSLRTPFSTRSSLKLPPRSQSSSNSNSNIDSSGNEKNENSKTVSLPGYQFFRRSGRRADDSNDDSKKNSGYVPSGMSRTEYSAIRKMETERERKMNYGAWGPRFRRTGRPDGDWMVMPNLWTFGQVDNDRKYQNAGGNGEENGAVTIRDRIQSLREAHGLAFLLGYFVVDSLCFGYALWKFKQIEESIIFRKTYCLAYLLSRLVLSAFRIFAGLSSGLKFPTNLGPKKAIIRTVEHTAVIALMKIKALKISLAIVQIPLWKSLMEKSNRRWLWSKKRFAVITTSTTTAILAVFGIFLLR